ncbi:hypothetical protein HZY86_01900 [Aerococcaceae bacterium DSM 111020]|nr:hypothetical protein [Aerococcaceae bacterium DSM 111020]
MVKEYDISKPNDIRKFIRELENEMDHQKTMGINQMTFDINCPECGTLINVKNGLNRYSSCNEQFNFNLDFSL